MKSKLARAGWIFLALLFVVTSLAGGVIYFLQSTHSSNDNNQQQSQQAKTTKLKGTQMKDFTPVAKVDKLTATDTKAGNGVEVKPGDTVTVIYTGAVASTGKVFDSNADTGQPLTISLSQVIAGWTDGVPGMKVGGQRRLLIPAAAAYGANAPAGSGIPANADLVFDITLLNTKSK